MKEKNENRRRRGCARVHAGVRTCMREVGAPESRGTGEEGMTPRKERADGGRSADESANENNKKGGYFEKPPSFCMMSVNRMLFLGGEGLKS